MASNYPTKPSIQSLKSITQQHTSNSDGVNLQVSMQLSICDSPPTTSTRLTFACQTNANSNGNRLFPLLARDENTAKHTQKMSWHVLLNYLNCQQIVKDVGIFRKFKIKQKYDQNTQVFPLEVQQIKKGEFPYRKGYSRDHTTIHLKREATKLKRIKFPLKQAAGKGIFPCSGKGIKDTSQVKYHKIYQMAYSKFKHQSKSKCTLRTFPIYTNLKRFPCAKTTKCNTNKEFPSQDNSSSFCNKHEKDLKFPQKPLQNNGSFPLYNKCQKKEATQNFKQYIPITQILDTTNYAGQSDQTSLTKSPCELHFKGQLAAHCDLPKFPTQDNKYTRTQFEYCFGNNHVNWGKEGNSKNPKTYCFPTVLMMQTGGKIKYIAKEHVFQVQDTQTRVEENPRSLITAENKQPPPQAATAKTMYDEQDDVNILADINAINNTRPHEVGYYAEKIECLQDAIVALFEKIQNSLTRNHNSEHERTNAAKDDYGDDIRFALTPPMSLTSVRNAKRNDNREVLCKKKYDLGDLCDRQVGQIVEYSEVLDTLAETVDYGVTQEQSKSTGSSLVKSVEPTSPNSLVPNPLNESEYTLLSGSVNVSELLPKHIVSAVNENNNADVKHFLVSDPITAVGTPTNSYDLSKLAREAEETIIEACESNLTSEKVNEMTVTRLTKNDQENSNEKNLLQSNEALENKHNILSNDLQIDEMKFEMNRVKGALPGSVSERLIGKHDSLITGTENAHYGSHRGTNTSLSNSKLPHSSNSTRNYNSSSYTPRPQLTNDISTLATTVPKQSILSAHLPQDGVTKRSAISKPSSNETIANQAALNTRKISNDSSTDTLSHRRPSLGALRSTQSTSLLSADLPRYNSLATVNPTIQITSVNRAVSIDVLPERTRLRRQRRLKTLNSQDESEDPIERLNRLKARISASLSEVKGVLKQYSAEGENENENKTAIAANSVKETKEDEKKEGPIIFRFVKKVRRRSVYENEDENEQKITETNVQLLKNETENHPEKQLEIKDETDKSCKLVIGSTLPTPSFQIVDVSSEKDLENRVEGETVAKIENKDVPTPLTAEINEIKLNTNICPLKEEVQQTLEDIKQTGNMSLPKTEEENENTKTLKHELQLQKDESKVETKGTIPKPAVKHETDTSENESIHETTKKPKRKIIIKSKDHARRASLAAVEGSKIEPPVKLAIPAKIERRPSDSEAVVKRKSITAKINTSGVVEEVTPKPQIVKVKKSSMKNNNNLQLATKQTKLKEEHSLVAQTANYKNDDHVKLIDKDNKSIHIDKNKDVLLPKQQINTAITRQTNSLLPAYVVIDNAASLNEKTIENSVLPPRQQQQQQQQLAQNQQATIKSTATNCNSNDLKTKGAMLENVTTVLSSSRDSEAYGQIKREKIVQQEDLYDLLQQETTIIKPATTNKHNELKLVNQIENRSNVADILTQQASTEKLNGNLKSVQTTQKPNEEQKPSTTDVARVKSENDDNKTKTSLNEPCIDKTTTSANVDHKQQQQQHPQLLVADEQAIANVNNTKTISSPHISISSTPDITHETTTVSLLPSEAAVEKKPQSTMPELQVTPAPVQTADINSHPEHHKKKIIIKRIVRQSSADKTEKPEQEKTKSTQQNVEQVTAEPLPNESKNTQESEQVIVEGAEPVIVETPSKPDQEDELIEECPESTKISESSTSIDCQEVAATQAPTKQRKVKKKVIIRRQKRRLSIGETFFHPGSGEDSQNAETETLEKAIAYVSDEESSQSDEKDEQAKNAEEHKEEKKPLKSCILHKEYNIGDEVMYAERFKKTQIKWRRGRVKERITSISYLLDIDGKDVSSHINYLKKYTGRKVSFGGKEYLEIDYEQLAEDEEKADRLQRRTYSIWNMV